MDLLLSVSLRALVPATVAAAVLWIARVRGAAARHAVWTVVTAGMLLSGLLGPLLPIIPLRILPARAVPVYSPPVETVVSTAAPIAIPVAVCLRTARS